MPSLHAEERCFENVSLDDGQWFRKKNFLAGGIRQI